MKLSTPVKLPDLPVRFSHHHPTLWMGSCFADIIGNMFSRYRFPVNINPFGTVFNPLSVLRGMDSLMHMERYGPADLEKHGGLWFSFDHYTQFSHHDPNTCLEGINTSLEAARSHLAQSRILVLTWGTAWVYSLKEGGRVVSNCHKLPADRFEHRRLEPAEITEAYMKLLPELFRSHPELKVLLTISPVRHLKDGAHGNQLSKASLLLAAEELCRTYPERIFYFPSYELVLDELRDYRFFAGDMVHPNELAGRFIWEKLQPLVDEESQGIILDLESWLKMKEHRPRDSSAKTLETLETRIEDRRSELLEKYPFIGLQ